MRKTRSETEGTRRRIVTTTARLVRERGIAGVGVAELMKQSGLTHGGFYKHFSSKDALVAEACEAALLETHVGLSDIAQKAGDSRGLQAVIESYLSPTHRDHPEQGCIIAAAGDEAVRGHSDIRQAISGGTEQLVALVAGHVKADSAGQALLQARGIVSTMIGGLTMARAVNDREASDAVLADVRAFLLNKRA